MPVSWLVLHHDLMLTFSVQLIFDINFYFWNDAVNTKKQAKLNIHQFFIIIKHKISNVTDLRLCGEDKKFMRTKTGNGTFAQCPLRGELISWI